MHKVINESKCYWTNNHSNNSIGQGKVIAIIIWLICAAENRKVTD